MNYELFNNKTHNIDEVAKLKYIVDYWTYEKEFSNKNEAIKALKELLSITENNDPNYELLLVMDESNNILGFVSIEKEKSNILYDILYLFKNLKFKYAIKFSKIFFIDSLVLSDFKKNELYVAELVINPKYQGKGYGTLVLKDLIKYAKDKKYDKLILDADLRNGEALKLYKRLGFKVFNKKISKLSSEKGMFNLEYIL